METVSLKERKVPERLSFLVVDDEEVIRELLCRVLHAWNYDATACADAETALEKLKSEPYHIVLSDIIMTDQDGLWLLDQANKLNEKPLFLMMTGYVETQTAIHCLTHGAYDFLLKPIEIGYLRKKIDSAVTHLRNQEQSRIRQRRLQEVALSERWKAQRNFLNAIDALIRALEAKDYYTEGHSGRVSVFAEGIATYAHLRSADIAKIVIAARCHDIGKIGVSDSILQKEGKLTEDEFNQIKTHSLESARILTPIFAESPQVIAAVRNHHERFDGRGYPDGLSGENIPLFARIIGVADAYDAMTSNRVYRQAMSSKRAVEEIIQNSGRQFCPSAVKSFLRFYHANLAKGLENEGEIWKERRRSGRYETSVQFNLLANGFHFPGQSVDVSREGMRLKTAAELSDGSELAIFANQGEPIFGTVQWSRKLRGESSNMELGISLEDISEQYQTFVSRVALPTLERRLNYRLNLGVPVNILINKEESAETLLNLSRNGAFIQSLATFRVNQEIALRFSLPGETDREIAVGAIITHVITLDEALLSRDAFPGIGVKFTRYENSSQRHISEFFEEQQGKFWRLGEIGSLSEFDPELVFIPR